MEREEKELTWKHWSNLSLTLVVFAVDKQTLNDIAVLFKNKQRIRKRIRIFK